MLSDQLQREISNEQLTPAEEKCTEVKEMMVKSEKEVNGQCRLMVDFSPTPSIIFDQKGMKHPQS